MALRPYAAAKRTSSFLDKLLEVNWGLVLLICMIGFAGIAMLYSVAGARFQPWALKQMGHFTLGLIVLLLLAGAAIWVRSDHRRRGHFFWQSPPAAEAPAVPKK